MTFDYNLVVLSVECDVLALEALELSDQVPLCLANLCRRSVRDFKFAVWHCVRVSEVWLNPFNDALDSYFVFHNKIYSFYHPIHYNRTSHTGTYTASIYLR